jgi:hypothetical protein
MKLEFSRETLENNQISNFMKILPVRIEFYHADRRTDMANLIALFAILRVHLIIKLEGF